MQQDRVEDFVLDEAGPLFEFRDRLAHRWRRDTMKDGLKLASEVAPALGDALVRVLSQGRPGRLVTKTPSVRNLDRFFELFPHASLIVLVRDPRSVVASAVGSWDSDWEGWARQWALRSRTILDFDARHQNQRLPYAIVRYEDILGAPRETTEVMLRTAGLSVDDYDFDALLEMPVLGSSESSVEGVLSWEPVERSRDFDPLRRWADWPSERLERLEWLAGDALDAFGYERTVPRTSGPALRHRARSVLLVARLAFRQGRRRLRVARTKPELPA